MEFAGIMHRYERVTYRFRYGEFLRLRECKIDDGNLPQRRRGSKENLGTQLAYRSRWTLFGLGETLGYGLVEELFHLL
jgi:hypothetical protein